jgi:hypothetical protein
MAVILQFLFTEKGQKAQAKSGSSIRDEENRTHTRWIYGHTLSDYCCLILTLRNPTEKEIKVDEISFSIKAKLLN